MGILDKKTRFIDLVVTQEGKRQMASGRLKAVYASLSDGNAFYNIAEKENVSERLYFEVMERPENSIVLETDDSGRIIPFDFSPTGSIVGNNIFDHNASSQNVLDLKAVTGSQFSSLENTILATSLKHFDNNQFIGTYDPKGRNEFETNVDNITFTLNNNQPFYEGPYTEKINVNNAEPFFLDSKLTHLDNFKFLPPKNMDGSNYGTYEDIRSVSKETWSDIKKRLGGVELDEDINLENIDNLLKRDSSGRLKKKSRKLLKQNDDLPEFPQIPKETSKIYFNKTSDKNNLILQIFENQDDNNAKMTKLDIIDAGVYIDNDSKIGRIKKHVFYAGKIFYDDFGSPTFVSIFTLIMD